MIPRIFSAHRIEAGRPLELSGDAANHACRVLRLRPGDDLIVFDGLGLEFPARIKAISRKTVTLSTGAGRDPLTESNLEIALLQGVCRGHRMDLLIQKSTELGVAAIHPIGCERSIVRLDEKRTQKKLEHWRQIAISACEQCGRAVVPKICAPASLAAAFEELKEDVVRLLLDPSADDDLGAALEAPRKIALLIGPEGGLTDGERAAAGTAGFIPVRMGPRVLRTETAPLAALSILQYLAGDLN